MINFIGLPFIFCLTSAAMASVASAASASFEFDERIFYNVIFLSLHKKQAPDVKMMGSANLAGYNLVASKLVAWKLSDETKGWHSDYLDPSDFDSIFTTKPVLQRKSLFGDSRREEFEWHLRYAWAMETYLDKSVGYYAGDENHLPEDLKTWRKNFHKHLDDSLSLYSQVRKLSWMGSRERLRAMSVTFLKQTQSIKSAHVPVRPMSAPLKPTQALKSVESAHVPVRPMSAPMAASLIVGLTFLVLIDLLTPAGGF
jgi:hypothetical protein